MRTLLFIFAVVLLPQTTRATGWNDFTQPIGDGYEILRANGVFLTHNGVVVIYDEKRYIVMFAVTPTRVFVKSRTFDGTDIFHIVEKQSDVAVGPLTADAFAAHPEVVKAGVVAWGLPTNPNPEAAREGQRFFVAAMALMVAGPIALLVVGASLIVLVVRGREQRRQADLAERN